METTRDYLDRLEAKLALVEAELADAPSVLDAIADFRRSRCGPDHVLREAVIAQVNSGIVGALDDALHPDLQRPDPLERAFDEREHAAMAALVYRRFGGAEAGAVAWRRLMQNSTTVEQFRALARRA